MGVGRSPETGGEAERTAGIGRAVRSRMGRGRIARNRIARSRIASNRAARWTAALLAALTVAGTAACAGPPSKGDVHGVTLNQSRNNVFILAREPSDKMPPAQLVSNFLQALTGDQKDPTFSVAQEYLTPEARGKWNPAAATTKIVQYSAPSLDSGEGSAPGGHQAALLQPDQPQAAATPTAVGAEKTVTVQGVETAEIDPFGFFKYQSQPVTQQFTVKYLGAGTGWRIDVPPDFRMVSPEAFNRAYQTYQSALPVYLPTRGVVPEMDQVYLTQDTGKVDYTYDALARAVLHGRYPSQNTHLKLAGPVSVDGSGLATVKIQVPPGGIQDFTDIQQALVSTFRDASELPQLLSPTPLTEVLVTYSGCTACQIEGISPQNTGLPTTVYWVCPQQQNATNNTNAAIVARQLPTSSSTPPTCPTTAGGKVQPVVGTAGVQLAKDAPIAVKQIPDSADVKAPSGTTMVAAVEADGSVVVLNDRNSDQRVWYTAAAAKNVTDLEWDPTDGSLWVVDANKLFRVQDPGENGPSGSSQQLVAVPGGTLTRFKPSLDGVRAVVVSGQPPAGGSAGGSAGDSTAAGSTSPALMVTIERTGDDVSLSTETMFFPLLAGVSQDASAPVLQSVTDAAWADGRTVVLLGVQAGSSTARLFRVYLDGSQDSSLPDSEDAQPAARHLSATTTLSSGHPSLWTFSDAPGPSDPATTVSYFKRSGGADNSQEAGWSPVVATVAGD